ncbi:MAG: T9SS type A sorting domain-containing protein [Vicingaceae bacterium]
MSTKFLLSFIILLTGVSSSVKATHSAGMEIFYRWTQGSTYEFTMVFYRNCAGFTAGAPTTAVMRIRSVSKSLNYTVQLNRLATSGIGVPPLQPPNLYNCVNGTFCTEEYVYRGTASLSTQANDWTFSYELCCLPTTAAPTNMQNNTLYSEAGLNNLDFPDTIYKTWSPIFHNRRPNHPGYLTDTVKNPPWVSICAKRDIKLSQAARNYKGFDMKYEFFIPQTTSGANNSYINGFSFSNPIPTMNGITIDSLTGMVEFKANSPSGTGIYLLGVKATLFDTLTVLINGSPTLVKKEKSFIKRNLFIVVEDSASCPDSLFAFKDSVGNSTISQLNLKCDDNPFKVSFKRRVLCSSIDTNGSEILLINAMTGDTVNVAKVRSDDCDKDRTTDGLSIYLDSALTGNLYYLMFKKGMDGNTFLTDCYGELIPLADTLPIAVTPPPGLGVLVTDTSAGRPDTLELECNSSTFRVWLDVPFKCASFNSSDFLIADLNTIPPTIASFNKITLGPCVNTLAHYVDVDMSQPMSPGYYAIALLGGSDGNRLFNSCYFEFDSSAMVIKVNDISLDLGPDIYYCKNSGWDTLIGVPPIWAAHTWSNNSFTNSTSIDTAGTYWLKVWTSLGCQTTDSIEVIEKNCYIGIDEGTQVAGFNVFPNPANDHIVIEHAFEAADLSVRIRNLQGQLVIERPVQSASVVVSVADLIPGNYFIELVNNREVLAKAKLSVK